MPGPAEYRHSRVSAGDVRDSILQNLQNILNTSRGNCLLDLERYGLPHLTSIQAAMPSTIAPYEAAIRGAIERFEPRLTQIRVRHAPSGGRDMSLRFEISGIIQDEDGRASVRFETFADDSGRMRLRG